MLLAVLCSALSLIPYLVVYQILLLIIQNEVTFGAYGYVGLHWNCGSHRASHPHVFCGYLLSCSSVQLMHKIKVKVLEHISRFNLGFFQERSPGQIKTTLFDDVDRVEQFLAHSTLELAQAIVVPLMMFIFMLRLHWVMALVMLIPMVLGIAIPMMMVGNYPDMSAELAEDTEKLNASANEFITAMPVIKMYHLTAEKFEQYRNALHLYTTCWKKMCVSSCNPLSIALVVLDSAILFTLPLEAGST
ncbi:MAG: ABC transporter transmembrane domain-containing protein [Eisenbergiella sp.]